MKLSKVTIENTLSYLNSTTLEFNHDITIIIGPNGGGKTNLLDIIIYALRRHLLISWSLDDSNKNYTFTRNENIYTQEGRKPNPHSRSATDKPKLIEIELKVTSQDIDNIKQIDKYIMELSGEINRKCVGFKPKDVWTISNINCIEEDQKITYKIKNDVLLNAGEKETYEDKVRELFRIYLYAFEAINLLREKRKLSLLSLPMLYLPSNRSIGAFTSSITLADFKESSLKSEVDAGNSKIPSQIIELATGRLIAHYRSLEAEHGHSAKDKLKSNGNISLINDELIRLGYDWNIVCTNANNNTYKIELKKKGNSFLISEASSGEKELLTYLFAISFLNVHDGLIIIDEPELHLHPTWQKILLKLFEKLSSNEKGNQFLLATHSPIFVTPDSIKYVSRVFNNEGYSEIVKLNIDSLPKRFKHIISIVNSHNNEKIFFADVVILVEGPLDLIFFNKVFKDLKLTDNLTKIYELISVNGKHNFDIYLQLLKAMSIPYALIADLDYINEIGDDGVKSLIKVDYNKIKTNVLDNHNSKDAKTLCNIIKEVINNDTSNLEEFWNYIEARHCKIKGNLDANERIELNNFIDEKRKECIFILQKGNLEEYLPINYNYNIKDPDKLIEYINSYQENFLDQLKEDSKKELIQIAEQIKEMLDKI